MHLRLRERVRVRSGRAAERPVTDVEGELRAAGEHHAARVRRLRINLAAWAVGTVALTAWWVAVQWRANGALASFGHEGESGQWNPTLWALGVGIWTLVVGIMALRVLIRRPPTMTEVDREAARTAAADPSGAPGRAPSPAARTRGLRRLDGVRRIRFHVAAWVLGMVIITPLWALIEWQDNGALERFSADGRPGSWEPWILYAGAIWAGAIAVIAVGVLVGTRRAGAPGEPG